MSNESRSTPRKPRFTSGTLARAAQDSGDAAAQRQHMKMILALVDKALPRGRK